MVLLDAVLYYADTLVCPISVSLFPVSNYLSWVRVIWNLPQAAQDTRQDCNLDGIPFLRKQHTHTMGNSEMQVG